MRMVEEIITSEGQKVLGWREVPIDSSEIGATAKAAIPRFIQVFIGKGEPQMTEMDFERKLFVIRKLSEKQIVPMSEKEADRSILPVLSSKTIVYKGMLTAEQLRSFYLDLTRSGLHIRFGDGPFRFSTNTFPSWERAHPNRYLIHNGEINTIRGNINWMRARQGSMSQDLLDASEKIYPIVDETR